ncbi:hypothetical protein LTR84_007201 [Exophiala bonariae]|uniref:FAD-binding domain-containing protein n=1 Tax=Exophiala bonariae TaxID=1690606 RepID=A0AAV9MZB5_9EURO|nr:hypothetical protein LTR84_007201 [Exophiala bonariae]
MAAHQNTITIIGSSLTGLILSLSLVHHGLYHPSQIKLYDLRRPDTTDPASSSGVILTPNGLKILDSLGILSRFAHQCWLSEYRTYKNDCDETVRKTLIANEYLYGYKNHRVWRRLLLKVLLEKVKETGIEVLWKSKFEGVVREEDNRVVFKVNGSEETAGILVGADGIHSNVRKYLCPDVKPEYTGVLGVLSHIRWDAVKWPYEDYERACTIQGRPGALVLMPEDRAGSVIMVAMQIRMEEQSRERWDALARDKEWLSQYFRKGYDDWGGTARSIIDAVTSDPNTMYMWPFMRMARLDHWSSLKGRVVIMGDAAHALPPSSGQGINQTLEDVYTFTELLKAPNCKSWKKRLDFWQRLRQERIDAVFDWATNATNVQRMPQAERDELVREGKAKDANATEGFDDMRWLYRPDHDSKISDWLALEN